MEEYVDALSDKHPEKTDAEAEREPSVREEDPSKTNMDRSIQTLSHLKADKSECRLVPTEVRDPPGDGVLFWNGRSEGQLGSFRRLTRL
jgi:hypothetical protein